MNPSPAPRAAGSPLFRLYQNLLSDQESQLRSAWTALGGIRKLLASPDPESLALAVDASQGVAQQLEALRQNRHSFREAAAAMLHVEPEAVTLTVIASRLPANESAALLRLRQRLQAAAGAVDHANRVNAVVLWWCLDFVQQVLADLQPHRTGGGYTATGQARSAAFGPTWQAQG